MNDSEKEEEQESKKKSKKEKKSIAAAIAAKSEEDESEVIKRKKFFLDRLVFGGKIGSLFPILIGVVILLLGIYAGIFPLFGYAGTSADAQRSYIFWVVFIPMGTYLLSWLVGSINNAFQEAYKELDVTEKETKKKLRGIFGLKGIIMTIIIAVPFILYDYAGLWIAGTEEGWLADVAWCISEGDSSWYPGLGTSISSPGFGAYLWLIIWSISWLYFGSFVWLSISFLIYMNTWLKKSVWRNSMQKVIREKRYIKLLSLSIVVFLPVAPYIAIKYIYQMFYVPWQSDTIGTLIIFGVFLFGIVISPVLVSNDISREKKKAFAGEQFMGYELFDKTTSKIFKGADVNSQEIMKTILMKMQADDIKSAIATKVMDSKLVRKIMLGVAAPIISYISRYLVVIL